MTSRRATCLAAMGMAMAAALAGCASSTTTATTTTVAPGSSSWVKDSTTSLNIYLPDADSIYWNNGFGTAGGARTVITGEAPSARYWSFTAYPVPEGTVRAHVHDTQIPLVDDRYTVTLAASCAGVGGTCLATGTSTTTGIVVMRLYVPTDVGAAGTGGVPLPSITYVSSSGTPITLAQASDSTTIPDLLATLRSEHGALPAALTRNYPPAAPVPVAVEQPPPVSRVSDGEGPFANPDNVYQHITYTSTRGNLVVSAVGPTYQSGPGPTVNDRGRAASASPQLRYWSLCTVLKGRHTGACLRDQQIRFPAGGTTFTVIVSPTCPVAGYVNCIVAGPEPLQTSLAYRNLLPSEAFAPLALTGPYELTATYVARPG